MSEISAIVLPDAQKLDGTEHVQISQQGNLRRAASSALAAVPAEINDVAGTSYTLLATDSGKIIVTGNGSAVAITAPAGLGTGFQCAIVQGGAGQVTISGSSATVANRQGFTKTAGQYAMVSLIAIAVDSLILGGDGA